MFCFLMQQLFDNSVEAKDAMSKVVNKLCPPFQKGELYPPVLNVHSAAVCVGFIDRGARVASGVNMQLAEEAAEFNQSVTERMEETFFLSPKIWESFDADQSGALSLDEFKEGMRGVDIYKEF